MELEEYKRIRQWTQSYEHIPNRRCVWRWKEKRKIPLAKRQIITLPPLYNRTPGSIKTPQGKFLSRVRGTSKDTVWVTCSGERTLIGQSSIMWPPRSHRLQVLIGQNLLLCSHWLQKLHWVDRQVVWECPGAERWQWGQMYWGQSSR